MTRGKTNGRRLCMQKYCQISSSMTMEFVWINVTFGLHGKWNIAEYQGDCLQFS